MYLSKKNKDCFIEKILSGQYLNFIIKLDTEYIDKNEVEPFMELLAKKYNLAKNNCRTKVIKGLIRKLDFLINEETEQVKPFYEIICSIDNQNEEAARIKLNYFWNKLWGMTSDYKYEVHIKQITQENELENFFEKIDTKKSSNLNFTNIWNKSLRAITFSGTYKLKGLKEENNE